MKPSHLASPPGLSRSLPFALLVALSGLAACAAPADTDEETPADAGDASDTQQTSSPLAAYAPGSDEADIVGTLQRLFDALESGDAELLRSVTDSSLVMHYAEVVDGQTTHASVTLDGLAERIASAEEPPVERMVERMWDPVVLMDGPLATIWTPYDFYVGDTFSHCGIDVANLIRTEDGWKIVGLSWTGLQPPACELHPEGPPSD